MEELSTRIVRSPWHLLSKKMNILWLKPWDQREHSVKRLDEGKEHKVSAIFERVRRG